MKILIETINHVGLVVKDRDVAEGFYVDVLGFGRVPGRSAWLKLNATNAIHLIPLGSGKSEHPHHRYRHVTLKVSESRAVVELLLGHDLRVFQADFAGNERSIASKDDALDFGTGSLFVLDPDGNTVEFLQLGNGIFAAEASVVRGRDQDP